MVFSARFIFILYIAFAASYDSALAHEYEEASHAIAHNRIAAENSSSIQDGNSSNHLEEAFRENSSKKECPASEKGHGPHQCHMGHCGYLPQALSFVFEKLEKKSFSSSIHILKSRFLEGFFRPPRHS